MTESLLPKRQDGKVDRRYQPQSKEQKKRNPRYKNARAPKGTVWCTHHRAYEPQENFSKNRSTSTGFNSRCREGQKAYREDYEARYGKRNDQTKSVRISKRVHSLLKTICQSRGVSMERSTQTAIKFWIEYCCSYPECDKPKGAKFGRCAEHVLAVNPKGEAE